MKKHVIAVFLLCVAPLALSGCGSSPDLETRMAVVEAKIKESGEKIQNEPNVQDFDLMTPDEMGGIYNPSGKRDPFKRFEGGPTTQVEDQLTSALERFELSDLTLTAVVWGTAKPTALFRAPDGYSYTAQRGTRIGRNGGKISRVARSRVMVQEEYRDPSGDITIRQLEIDLHLEEEQKKQELESLEFKFSDQ